MNKFINSPGIVRREDFGTLLNLRGLDGVAVEIGTHLGEFAAALLSQWKGKRLVCVDPWVADIPGYTGQDSIALRNRSADLEECKARLAPYGSRVEYLRMLSDEAAPLFDSESIDFVYIDGNHQYESVIQDLHLWYAKVRSGGIFAGHDWASDWIHTVQRAVREFSKEFNLTVFLVSGDAWSWYAVKP